MNPSRISVIAASVVALILVGTGQGVATSSTPTARIAPQSASSTTGSWSAVGASPDGPVYALTMDNGGALYVGGDFDTIGSQALRNIARWRDDTYAALGAGLDDTVRALAWDDTLYIGGQFGSEIGGVAESLSGVAAWATGGADDTFLPLGMGVVRTVTDSQTPTRSVLTILPTDDTIYFGGEFASASSVAETRRLAGWIDDTWASVGDGIGSCPPAQRVVALAEFGDDTVIVGGKFRCAGASGIEDDTNISMWNGSAWIPMNGGVRPSDTREGDIVADVIVHGDTVYVGGAFINAGPVDDSMVASSLATWSAGTWQAWGGGVFGNTCGPTLYDPDVKDLELDAARGLMYVAGAFCTAGQTTVNSVATWDMGVQEWVPFVTDTNTGIGTAGEVFEIIHDDSVLYVGGRFTSAGGNGGPNNLARWTWQPPTGSNTVSASPGHTVSLSGSRFIGVPASGGVYFGGVPSPSYVRDDTTSFSAVVIPSGISGTVNIEVDAVGGRASVGTLTVPGPPPPRPPHPTPASAPRDVTATAGDASASVSWLAPASTGSFAITSYEAVALPGGWTCTVSSPSLSCDVTGLTNGTSYTFTVRALTAAGWSAASAPSNAVTPQAVAPSTITIIGSRDGKRIEVSGTTTGFGMGGTLRPWFRFPGESGYSEGSATILVSMDGTFEWGRKTGKPVSVYVQTPDRTVQSNVVRIARS